ncbi:DsbE family thiol:disulfide interchange protein [Devosia rhodophyticola]|uniref:DsbE family thiol:disulfide interchange protein n=1 Tax=Devosia rhodophyticola TaxID=3026423 RepID=A0ABY7YST6_9HYPH|nr:DsbE family thiol:disulfide interchange protein [Devosia rhodophyticola]WDR04431.1 DsbE family thiol:disulfide interchange protein [Devosia rhodophyticola]
MRYVFFGLPLLLLAALLSVFAFSINRDPNLVRSVLIDKPAPQFDMPAVAGLGVTGFDTQSLVGEVTVVNVFASWCVPCREEHPVLTALKDVSGVRLFGINQADKPENAVAFLEELGNPYDRVGADENRRVSIDWGVYGVPETFIVDARGVIAFKHVGPMTGADVEKEILPAIKRARAVKP